MHKGDDNNYYHCAGPLSWQLLHTHSRVKISSQDYYFNWTDPCDIKPKLCSGIIKFCIILLYHHYYVYFMIGSKELCVRAYSWLSLLLQWPRMTLLDNPHPLITLCTQAESTISCMHIPVQSIEEGIVVGGRIVSSPDSLSHVEQESGEYYIQFLLPLNIGDVLWCSLL